MIGFTVLNSQNQCCVFGENNKKGPVSMLFGIQIIWQALKTKTKITNQT